MKLVIPMSGQGSRFAKVGYTVPKPLILVEGKPIIAHVLDMFPGENDVIFICSEEHLETTNMREILKGLKPEASIVSMPSRKKGPIYAMTFAYDLINDDEDVMVSYCDFTQNWDYSAVKTELENRNIVGAVPAYTGFHPHLLHKNLYGGMLVDDNNIMQDYREKYSFTENPENSHHSGGAYYFKSGALMKKLFNDVMEQNIEVGGEHYVSLAYYLLDRDTQPVYVPTVTHFMQWGTPEDLEEFEAWSRLIHKDAGIEKAHTDIPPEREQYVTIPHDINTPEFKKSYEYWKSHFTTNTLTK